MTKRRQEETRLKNESALLRAQQNEHRLTAMRRMEFQKRQLVSAILPSEGRAYVCMPYWVLCRGQSQQELEERRVEDLRRRSMERVRVSQDRSVKI